MPPPSLLSLFFFFVKRPHLAHLLYLPRVHQPPATMLITPWSFFLYYSPLCYFCHPLHRGCFYHVASSSLGSAAAADMKEGGRRAPVPNSTTNGRLASSDWHRLEGSWCWCCVGGVCSRCRHTHGCCLSTADGAVRPGCVDIFSY